MYITIFAVGYGGGVLETGVCKVDFSVEGGRRGSVWFGSEEREHFLIHVDAQGAYGEDVASKVEFAVLEFGEEEWWVDVWLNDEVT